MWIISLGVKCQTSIFNSVTSETMSPWYYDIRLLWYYDVILCCQSVNPLFRSNTLHASIDSCHRTSIRLHEDGRIARVGDVGWWDIIVMAVFGWKLFKGFVSDCAEIYTIGWFVKIITCRYRPIFVVEEGGCCAGSYLADPTSPIPSISTYYIDCSVRSKEVVQ